MQDQEDEADDGLAGLREPELFDEDQDAADGDDAHSLDDDVDPVAAAPRKGACPEEEDEQEGVDAELGGGLREAVAVEGGDYATTCEHVDDYWNEKPPVLLTVVLVEERVFLPCLLVVVQGGIVL